MWLIDGRPSDATSFSQRQLPHAANGFITIANITVEVADDHRRDMSITCSAANSDQSTARATSTHTVNVHCKFAA